MISLLSFFFLDPGSLLLYNQFFRFHADLDLLQSLFPSLPLNKRTKGFSPLLSFIASSPKFIS